MVLCRVTLFKAVTFALHVYTMQAAKLSSEICHKLDKLNRNFLWDQTPDKKTVHLISLDTACVPKRNGGLGIKKMKRDQLFVSPQLPNDAGGASDGIEMLDSSSASFLQDQREGRIPDVSPVPAQSLASFRRSRLRQRALELRNSAKADR
ncbi:hypothetical protein Ddye_026780, partial [Dipteronia dyeriana]